MPQVIEFGGDGLAGLKRFANEAIVALSFSKPEGNRIFHISLKGNSGKYLHVISEMHSIGDDDEISSLSFSFSDCDISECQSINVEPILKNEYVIYKITGEDDEVYCDCGIVIESKFGSILIISGSFPYSMHLMMPGYHEKISINNFQNLRFGFEKALSFP